MAILPTHDLDARIADIVGEIRARTTTEPRVGITLGSGLGALIDALEQPVAWATSDLPHWPPSTVPGHRGRLVFGAWRGVPVVALAGRSHRYEGYSLDRVTLGARVMHALGARILIFTNAAGALSAALDPGDLMLATDHINFIGKRGLFTPAELTTRRMGRPIEAAYDADLARGLQEAAAAIGVVLKRGILIGGHGPSYETAAEVRMAAALGADAACMSTVHEATVAAHLGCRVASLSCVTNRATGLSERPLTHQEVTEAGHRVASRLRALLEAWLERTAP